MWNRYNYSRKLFGMALIVGTIIFYLQRHSINFLLLFGFYFLAEHYFIWDRWDFYDYLIGHEWWAMYLMTISLITNYLYLPFIWAGFLFGATYNKSNPFKELIPTIKEFWSEI